MSITRSRKAGGRRTLARQWRRLWVWIRLMRRDRHSRRARRVILMLILLWIVNGFDLVFTLLANGLGTFEELNPIAVPLLDDPVLLVTFKVLMVLFASVIILKFRRRLLTEIGCWALCLAYLLLSIRWLSYFLYH